MGTMGGSQFLFFYFIVFLLCRSAAKVCMCVCVGLHAAALMGWRRMRRGEEAAEECDMCSVIDLNSFPETFPGEAGTVLLCSPGLSEPMQNQYPI